MDIIDSNEAVLTIVTGASGYLSQFMPLFVFVIGLALAFAVITAIINAFFGKNVQDEERGI